MSDEIKSSETFPWHEAADAILATLRQATRDCWDGAEDSGFLQQAATDMARERWLAATSEGPAKAAHLVLLRHVEAAVLTRIARKELRLKYQADKVLAAVFETAVGILGKIVEKKI